MLRDRLLVLLSETISQAIAENRLPAAVSASFELTETKNPDHGDFSTNIALAHAKSAAMNPRALAELVVTEFARVPMIRAIEIAGPGFINLRLHPEAITPFIGEILNLGTRFANTIKAHPKTINLEYVSVNPNGPITVGSGRGAAFGDTLKRVLTAAGDKVAGEYYINDGVNSQQMRLFAESVRHYIAEAEGLVSLFPEGGYKGDYVKDVAVQLMSKGVTAQQNVAEVQELAQALMIERQKRDLAAFGVQFDLWFSEQSLHNTGAVASAIDRLKALGSVDDEPYFTETLHTDGVSALSRVDQARGPLWLRSSKFGDEKDRVLVRADGRPAYIAGDLAYMENKLGTRHFDKAIIVLGPDHHGYIGRMNAVCEALGYPLDRFQIVIFQIVRFVRDGQVAPMRKRDGNIYELQDLINEVGSDVARFFYLMRSHETHMDFDIDLATKKSDDNPVFYVQYAHARISSVIAKGLEAGFQRPSWLDVHVAHLQHPKELALVKKILQLPEEVQRCAADYGVHRLTTFAVELSRMYHHFYDACRVVQPDEPELSAARLALCEATRIGLRATLDLLGISAPERMDRAAVEA